MAGELEDRLLLAIQTHRDELEARIAILVAERDALQIEFMATCPHNTIIEGSFRDCIHGSADPPFRVCVTCGYAEEGWGAGYWRLTAGPQQDLVREIAWKHVRKYVRQKEMILLGRYGAKRQAEALEECQ